MNVANSIVIRVNRTEVGHLCYMRPLKVFLAANAGTVLYVIYDFETTQNKRYSDIAKVDVPILACVQTFCARCEDMEVGIDCERCGKRRHSLVLTCR